MALVSLLSFLPTLLLTAPAEVLADGCDRRLLMMIGDGCSGHGVLYIVFIREKIRKQFSLNAIINIV